MTPERWQLTQDLLEKALLLTGQERTDFLVRSCDGDQPLREEIEALLVIDTNLGDFIEKPLFDMHGDQGSLAAGDQLGPWRIVREIGRGGMGAVYLAERADATYEKKVAVKLLKRGMDTDELVRRFRSERRILALLEHPHIARLLDGGSTPDGRPYLVMEYVEGRPIDAWCIEQSLSVEDRLALFEKVCRAVHFAHRNLVVHRDLKPGNILVVADGEPRLLDFGIAKLLGGDPEPFATVAAFLPMTPEYASPEQIRGEPVTTATDIYSLGVLLYRLLAGRSPYRPAAEGRAALAEAVCNQEPLRPSTVVGARAKTVAEASSAERDRHLAKRLRGDLDTIAQKALSKNPGRRYESAEQLASDIRRHLEGLPVLARPSGVGYRTSKFVGRHKIGVVFATAALLAIIGTAAVALVQRSEAIREKNRAEDERKRAEWASNFINGVFEINNPSESHGREVKAIDLLEKARKQLENSDYQPIQSGQLHVTLGRVYSSLGQFETSKNLFSEAIDLYSQVGMKEGPQVLEATVELAQAEGDLGNDSRAEELMKQGLRLLGDSKIDENTVNTLALNNYGGLLLGTKRRNEAEKYFIRALAIEKQRGRLQSHAVAIALAGLGDLRSKQGRFPEAEDFYRRSLALRRLVFGEPSVEVAKTMNSLATLLEKVGKDREAEDLYLRSITMRKTVLGPSHPRLGPPLSNLSRFYEERGRLEKVEAPYREAVSICAKSGNEDRNCGVFISHLASFLAEQGRCGEAEPLGVQALALLEAKSGDKDAISEAQSVVGGCRSERRDFVGAEPLLLQAFEATKEVPSSSLMRKRILDRLTRLYDAMGRPDQAAKYRPAAPKPGV
ncbi:MAG: serine/threonine-protein kinase [Acidobacteriota bacterium]